MTPTEFRKIRLSLTTPEEKPMSCRRMALALGLQGHWCERTVRRWEKGVNAIPASIAARMEEMKKGLRDE